MQEVVEIKHEAELSFHVKSVLFELVNHNFELFVLRKKT